MACSEFSVLGCKCKDAAAMAAAVETKRWSVPGSEFLPIQLSFLYTAWRKCDPSLSLSSFLL